MRLRLAAILVLACVALGFPARARAGATSPAAAGPVFIANQGQLSGPARYYARQSGGSVYFEPAAVVFDRAPQRAGEPGLVVRVTFPAREPDLELLAAAPQAARVNSFAGADPTRWRAAVPTYGEVRYAGIAPGADLAYRVADGALKYDVQLAPGADLGAVRLRYEGVRSLALDPAGELILRSDAGDLREAAPFLYQEHDGRRVPVQGGYRAISDHEVGFWVEGHDPRLPLVVDPAMIWSSFLGGAGDDFANGIAADATGNLIVVGSTGSGDYPTTTGAYRRTPAGARDVFVTKLRADGSGLVWSTYLGGAGADEARGVAVDAGGAVYLCGRTGSADFPVTAGAFQRAAGGGPTDGFVAKLASGGGRLVFCTRLGGDADDYVAAIALDRAGNPAVAGVTGSGDFPTTPGAVRPTWTPDFADGADGFVAKLSTSGSSLIFSTYLGGGSADGVAAIALDGADQPMAAGNTKSSDFPVTAGALRPTLGGAKDGFVTVLSADGSAYRYSTYLGGGDLDAALAVGRDGGGGAYVAGYTTSADLPTTAGAPQRGFGGGTYDGFLCKLAPGGDAFTLGYCTYLGGGGEDVALAVAVGADGLASVTGYTTSTDFPVTAGAHDASANGADDAFVVAVAPDGRSLWYSSYLGGSGTDDGYGLVPLGPGRVAVCGSTTDGSFPTTTGAYDRTHASPGAPDGFVTILDLGAGPNVDAGAGAPPGLGLAAPQPSPFAERTWLRLTLARPTSARVAILDVRGRVVATVARGELPAGSQAWLWDGRDDGGAPVAPGLYWVEAVAGEERWVRRLVRLR